MDSYRKVVLKTVKISPDDQLLWAALGICVDAGEFANFIKKSEFHNQELDRDQMIRKLGDIAWYLELAAHNLGVSMDQVKEQNIAKLRLRYPEAFNDPLSPVINNEDSDSE